MDIYSKLGEELRSLFRDLNTQNEAHVRSEMGRIQKLADRLGSPLSEEAARLKADLDWYLRDPTNPKWTKVIRDHALRLGQETREL